MIISRHKQLFGAKYVNQ